MEEDEIAIVGAGCRFSGADNLDEFWKVLVNGENHVREIPESRWNNRAFYDEDPNVPGKSYVKEAGLLKDHDKFDYRLFGISEVEAARMDPQQRYVLECVHMAMEDGGFTRKQMSGTNTGVIIGCMNDDYKAIVNDDLKDIGGYNATGTSVSVISARVSYVYNLHGTCLTLDTACSSALVAIHLASQAIRTGDCDMMICGGVSSIMSPDIYVALCKARMMSATGQCQSFCETADGYARGEGCGIVILKSLKAARLDGNKIWATIKTGSNQDGCMAKPITAPSGEQQFKLLKRVYEKHKFNPSEIQYIEAHGTGTPIGDPTELNALGQFFSSSRNGQLDALPVGSVKSNIGHTESAAGIAGLLKVLLMMTNGQFVPSLHINPDKSNLNKKIKLSEYGLDISTLCAPWPLNQNNERHACLNSFGFGGSNTHAIISFNSNPVSPVSHTEENESNATAEEVGPFPVCISGIDQESLKHNLLQLYADLDETEIAYQNLTMTSFQKRDLFPYRTFVFGNSKSDIQKECKTKSDQVDEISPKKKNNIVFVYCGVGTTWTGMGRQLMEKSRVFRDTVQEIDKYLEPLTGWSIAEKFTSDSNYDDPFLNHIAIFSVQVAITELWKSFGVVPNKIIGQSVGEVAAAYTANCLSLEAAVNVIYYRSLILSKQSQGSMTVVGNIDLHRVEEMCSKFEDKVCIAVYSSPTACTLSGSKDDLKLFAENLKNEETNTDLFVRELKVKCAYHSHFLEGCMGEIRTTIDDSLSRIESVEEITDDKVPFISTVTGEVSVPKELRTGAYWAANIRQPVKFMQSIKKAFEDEIDNVYLEIGPRPVLKAHIANIFDNMDQVLTMPSVTINKEIQTLYGSLAKLFEIGIDINSLAFGFTQSAEVARIPRYAFNKTGDTYMPNKAKVYLSGSTTSSASHMYVQSSKGEHETTFKILLDEESTPFIFEHFLSDNIIVPGATYIEAGFHIGSELLMIPANRLSVGFSFVKTFSPPKGRQTELIIDVDTQADNPESIRFNVKETDAVLASGSVTLRKNTEQIDQDIDYLKALCITHRSKMECYAALEQYNFKYGERLSLIQQAWLSESGKACLAEIKLPDSFNKELLKTHFHPSVIDSLLQMFGVIVGEMDVSSRKDVFAVPKGVDSVCLNRTLEQRMYGFAEEVKRTVNSIHYNAILMTTNGTVIANLENFYTRVISKESTIEDKPSEFELKWIEQDLSFTDKVDLNRIFLFSNSPEEQWIHNLKGVTKVKHVRLNDTVPQNGELKGSYCIIYHVSDRPGNSYGKSIIDETVRRFTHVQQLLTIYNQSDDLPITIVTENTKACPDRDFINYAGSELWGMVRSALHEGFYGKVRLIDVDPNKMDISVFLSLISSNSQTSFEYAISGSRVYQSTLTSCRDSRECTREISVKAGDYLSIHTSSSNCVSNPYLLVSENVMPDCGFVSVEIESFTIHDKLLYIPVVTGSEKSENILQTDKDVQIVMLEGRGKILGTKKEVVFLYPTKATTCVNIPEKCVFDKKDCPFYQSGILMLTNVMVQIVSAVEYRKNIAVLKQTEEEDIGERLFKVLMQRRRCKVRCYVRKDVQREGISFKEDTLVIATTTSTDSWIQIAKSFPYLKKIITLSIFMPDHLLLWIKHTYTDIAIEVISTMDIFSCRRILEAIPMINSCIQEFRANFQVAEGNHFLLKLPMQKSELKRDIENHSLKCYITTKTLFRSDASYIIIGGLSGLGWELLQSMAETGAKVLITMSRRGPTDSVKEKIKYLEKEHECRIIPLPVDICNLESIQFVFNRIRCCMPTKPIRGIFHGAGITSDSILQNLDVEKVAAVMKPKVQGVWNLHISSLNLPLDYFVIHSSIASVLGNPGQCNYAAANSFLDSFALYRRSIGLPGQSINWGALEVGMAAETDEVKSKLKEKGFNLLGKDKIREYFAMVLLKDTTNVVLADMEWEKLLSNPSFAMQSVKFDEFQKVRASSKMLSRQIRLDLDEFNEMDEDQKKEKVKSVLREIIQLVLVTEEDSLSDETRLTDIGIDSMAAMSLSNAMFDTFGVREQVVNLLSDEATISIISENILQKLGNSATEGGIDDGDPDDLSEFRNIFESKDVTFMQKDILDKCRVQKYNPYFLFVLDIEVSGLKLPLLVWRKIFIHALKLNPGFLRKYSFLPNGEIAVETAPEDDPPVNVTRISMKEFDKSQKFDVREDIIFDINGSLPIALHVADSIKKAGIRLIVHKLALDLRGLTIFCRDIGKTLEAVVNKKELPPKGPDVDVPSAIRRSILPRMRELKKYWENYTKCDLRPITFGPGLQEIDSNFCRSEDVIVPSATVVQIKKYIAKQSISLYEFMMSLYQLYLYIGSGSTLVTVGTAADMRYHVPELNNVLTRCVNYIPIIANINEEETLTHFIKYNSAQLSTTTQNGAYPSSLILENIKSNEMRENINRHVLAMNDLTGLAGESTGKKSFKFRRILHERPNRETYLYVQYNLKQDWIKFQLGFNSEICGRFGYSFADILLSLANQAIEEPTKSVKMVKEALRSKQYDEPVEMKMKKKLKLKRSTYGGRLRKWKKGKKEVPKYTIGPVLKENHQNMNEHNGTMNIGSATNGSSKTSKGSPGETIDGMLVKIKDILMSGEFSKQTSYGWDHKVEARLIIDSDNRLLLEWGKERRTRGRINKIFDLSNMRKMVKRKINDMQSLIFVSNGGKLVFKTPDRTQAEHWMNQIRKFIRKDPLL